MRTRENEKITYTDWREGFANSFNSKERLSYLEQGLAQEDSRENQFRKTLWDARYTDGKGRVTGADFFMAQWLKLSYQGGSINSAFAQRRIRKEMQEVAKTLQLEKAEDEELKQVLYEEYINVCSFYISLCQQDRNYKSILFGIGSVGEDALILRIAKDVYSTAIVYPEVAGYGDTFALFSKAAKEAFFREFPRDYALWDEAVKKMDRKYRKKDKA